MLRKWRRFCALAAADRALIVEAAVLVALVWAGLRLAPFRTVHRALARLPASRPSGRASPDRIGWAVAAAGRRLPLRTSCLSEALAAEALLRRRGLLPLLRFGVRRPRGGRPELEAHAWVECGGRVVVGRVERFEEYAALSRPPSPSC